MTAPATGKIDRRDLLPQLFEAPDNWLFVSGLAGASKDTAALTNDGANMFGMAGTMGSALPTGLGMALSVPDRDVAVVTGDGELLMGIGSLITVAAAAPKNLTIICIDNGMHGETGGQGGHTSTVADIAKIAEGSGIASVMTITTPEEIPAAAEFLKETPAPRFLLARVQQTAPSAFKRDLDMAAARIRFKDAYRKAVS